MQNWKLEVFLAGLGTEGAGGEEPGTEKRMLWVLTSGPWWASIHEEVTYRCLGQTLLLRHLSFSDKWLLKVDLF